MTVMQSVEVAQGGEKAPLAAREVVFDIHDLSVSYGSSLALAGVNLEIYKNVITALIGPSGCGKSTFIRCLNRMNDLVGGARVDGKILYHGEEIYDGGVDPIEVRRRIGMVFQRPNPFPKSIYENVAFAPKALGMKSGLAERVERALRGAALWDEVKDVVLLDEPASALDPISTQAIEDLMQDLKRDYTLVIVTHNMQQAARVADMTAFFSLLVEDGTRTGVLVEYADTPTIFTHPADKRTEDYVTGRFG